jgi:hypothetical protein
MMPFRSGHLQPRISRWILPAFVLMGVALIAAWCVWTVTILPGGFRHVTPAQTLFIAGFAGICAFTVFGAAVVIAVMESALAEARSELLAQLLVLANRRVTGSPAPSEHPEEE